MSEDPRPALILTWAASVHMTNELPFRTLTIGNDGDGAARELSVSVEHQGDGAWDSQDRLEPGRELSTEIPLVSDVRWACAFIESIWVSDGPLVTPHVTITWKQGPTDELVTLRLLAPPTPDPIPEDARGYGESAPRSPVMFVSGKR